MNKCCTQPYQRCTVGTGAPLYVLNWTVRQQDWIQSRHLLGSNGDVNDHRPHFWLNFLKPAHFVFFSPSSPRAQGVLLHIWASAIMQMKGPYLHKCPWTTAINHYQFAIQNNSHLSCGNCCRQIRLTLNMYLRAFGDIVQGCLYNFAFTCKQ